MSVTSTERAERFRITHDEGEPQLEVPSRYAAVGRRVGRQLGHHQRRGVGRHGGVAGAAKHLSRRLGLAGWFRQWAQLEREAIILQTYECRLVPGLLQTEAYARTLFAEPLPPLGDEQIEAQLAARLERQELLRQRPNTAYSFILEEHLLLRRTGGRTVAAGLIEHLLELASLRNIELQIMPVVRKRHAGLGGPMQLLETPEKRWFGYCEGQESGQSSSPSQKS